MNKQWADWILRSLLIAAVLGSLGFSFKTFGQMTSLTSDSANLKEGLAELKADVHIGFARIDSQTLSAMEVEAMILREVGPLKEKIAALEK